MKRKFIPAAAALTLTGIVLFNNITSVGATDTETLRQNLRGLQSQTSEAEQEGERLARERSRELSQIDIIEAEILETESILSGISVSLENTTRWLEEATEELEEATTLREEQQQRLVDRARAMHMNGPVTYLDALLTATSFSDLLMRLEFVGRVIEHDNNLVGELKETEALIEDRREGIYTETQRLAAFEVQQNTRLQEHERILDERVFAMKAITDQERDLQEMQLQLDREIAQIERELRSREFTARATAGASTNRQITITGEGQMAWPVPSRVGVISSPFGPRRSPITGRQEHHTGIDIPAPTGSELVAAQDGVVIFSGWMNGYGNTVRIDHGDNVVTLYGHNSSNMVSVGQSIRAGQQIGRIGSTGFSTGPHSHFEVRYQGTAVNPMNFLN